MISELCLGSRPKRGKLSCPAGYRDHDIDVFGIGDPWTVDQTHSNIQLKVVSLGHSPPRVSSCAVKHRAFLSPLISQIVDSNR